MKLFDILNDICNVKSNSMDKKIDWDDVPLSPYMLQRWLSFSNIQNAMIVNEYMNRFGLIGAKTKEDAYHLATAMTQKSKKYYSYAKKAQPKDEDKDLEKDGDKLGLSRRERALYSCVLEKLK